MTEQFPHRLYSFFCNCGAILTFPQFSQLYSCAEDSHLDTTRILKPDKDSCIVFEIIYIFKFLEILQTKKD